MQARLHCTAAVLLLSIGPAAAQTPAAYEPVPGEATFTIFIGGKESGREQVALTKIGPHWIITSTGRIGDQSLTRFEVKYTADWQPVDLRLETARAKEETRLLTSFGVTTAINEITQKGATSSKVDQISARTIVLPNNVFAGHEALAARLSRATPGTELPLYVVPSGELKLTVKAVTDEPIDTPAGTVATRNYALTVNNVDASFEMAVSVDARSRLARLEAPSLGLAVVRSDLAGVAVRTESARNPTDSDVTIFANGFNIAGTLTTPRVGRLRHPAVILVPGAGQVDRDSTIAGIPILSQLAGALAERGFIVLRYDKRGVGQSGGRTESATQQDYADDLVTVVKWMERRDDVDDKRVAVVGHAEGGAIAMLAAGREKKITSLVLLATPGTSGAELILEQQRDELDRLKATDAQKEERVALQRRIQQAVLTGAGWEAVPPELRAQAETPWFKSLLLFDPAKAMERIRQPVLVIQGALDTQVRPHHADKLGELARSRRKDAGAVEVVHVPGINHLLVPATTGSADEYATLADKTISPKVAAAIADWLGK